MPRAGPDAATTTVALGRSGGSIHPTNGIRRLHDWHREAHPCANLRIIPRIVAGNCRRLWRFIHAWSGEQSAAREVTPASGSRPPSALATLMLVSAVLVTL